MDSSEHDSFCSFHLDAWTSRSKNQHRWPCSCSPPTVWGETLLWWCECCEQPRAERRFMLCEVCAGHEQSMNPVEIQSDHDEMRIREETAPSPGP